MIVSAPGKVMLLGDYGVLAGGHAMIAAVNRRAIGRVVRDGRSSPVVDAVLARAGRRSLQVEIDTGSFYEGDLKLGLGSSAAVAVVTAALATDRADERTLEIADEALHRSEAVVGARLQRGVHGVGDLAPHVGASRAEVGHRTPEGQGARAPAGVGERMLAGQELVEDEAGREDVGAHVGVGALEQLRRAVVIERSPTAISGGAAVQDEAARADRVPVRGERVDEGPREDERRGRQERHHGAREARDHQQGDDHVDDGHPRSTSGPGRGSASATVTLSAASRSHGTVYDSVRSTTTPNSGGPTSTPLHEKATATPVRRPA